MTCQELATKLQRRKNSPEVAWSLVWRHWQYSAEIEAAKLDGLYEALMSAFERRDYAAVLILVDQAQEAGVHAPLCDLTRDVAWRCLAAA